jgi:hypothetical protein
MHAFARLFLKISAGAIEVRSIRRGLRSLQRNNTLNDSRRSAGTVARRNAPSPIERLDDPRAAFLGGRHESIVATAHPSGLPTASGPREVAADSRLRADLSRRRIVHCRRFDREQDTHGEYHRRHAPRGYAELNRSVHEARWRRHVVQWSD